MTAAQTSPPVAGPGERQRVGAHRLPGWLVVAVPVAGELLLGGYRIASPSFWRDEAATISGSNRPAGAIWALTSHQDAVHGLYYLLIHAVIAIGGTTETALRLPSLIAMALAAGMTALLGRRLARGCCLPAPGAIGLLAGLLLAVVPLTTRYAQEARPYALTTLFAVTATCLLVRAATDGRWPWWTAYAAAVTVTALFNLFALLLVVAHGLTLLAARSRSRPTNPAPHRAPPSTPASAASGPAPATAPASAATSASAASVQWPLAAGAVARWLIACGTAAVLLAPVAVLSVRQSAQLNWVTRPDLSTVATLVRDFSGLTALIPVVALLTVLGCAAGPGLRRGAGLTLAVVTLPWLIVPPALLLAISLADPLYVERYVMFCLPALSLLAAAGLIWLAELTRRAVVSLGLVPGPDAGGGPASGPARMLPVVPSAALAIAIVVALIGPQQAIRLPSARADNLRAVTAVVAARERRGDAIVYLPWDAALVGLAYPAPFAQLRNIGLAAAPVPSATLRGRPAAPGVVTARLHTAPRVWIVQWIPPTPSAGQLTRTMAASGLHLIRRWHIQSVQLSLYAR